MNCPHCKVEINKHEATRCLDAWIAYEIFGQSVELLSAGVSSESDWVVVGEVSYGIPGIVGPRYVNKYSTNMQAAWMLVSITKGWFDIERIRNYDATPEYEWWDVAYGNKSEASADTVELAICRAAIKAKGNKDGNS